MDLREPVIAEPSIPQLVARLTHDARDVARAEIALAKAKASEAATRYKKAAVLFAVAGVLALAALITLLVGLVLTLATLIGPGLATAAVVGAVLIVALALSLAGRSRLAARPGA
ncbi:phage holin family protein [Sphingomonas phyllosphaerae]|uniref:phage holin family protein n=1 Tax=Sphingomonas phyllosphaerae TaxID=257003 RepID=UPI002412FF9E|nr:phage holin family protein [Sphingomonas phyllosphaerae]